MVYQPTGLVAAALFQFWKKKKTVSRAGFWNKSGNFISQHMFFPGKYGSPSPLLL